MTTRFNFMHSRETEYMKYPQISESEGVFKGTLRLFIVLPLFHNRCYI